MKKMKTVVLVTLLALSLATWVHAGKPGSKPDKGGGGGTSSSYPPVTFTLNNTYDLFGDSASVGSPYTNFEDEPGGLFDPGVQAELAGSGNPLLRLGQSNSRAAFVDLGPDHCTFTEPETSALFDPDGAYSDGIVPIQGISPYGVSGVDGNFVGMSPDYPLNSAETLLGIGLEAQSDGRGWSVRFDPAFGNANLATVTQEADGLWLVDTLNCTNGCRAAIVRPPLKKGKDSNVVVGTCNDLRIQFSVTCDYVDDTGQCVAPPQ